MPTPPLSPMHAELAVLYVRRALELGYKIDGSPSAIEEAARRYAADVDPINRKTFRSRFVKALEMGFAMPGFTPKAEESAEPLEFAWTPDALKKSEFSIPAQADPHPFLSTFPEPEMKPGPKAVTPDQVQIMGSVKDSLRRGRRTLDEMSGKAQCSIADVVDAMAALKVDGYNIERRGDAYEIAAPAQPAWTGGAGIVIDSLPDNTFRFAAIGDLHAGSKYCRWDVRDALVAEAEKFRAQAIMDTGNWIDGEARFNKYDLDYVGLDRQVQHLAQRHPKTKLPIYAITGDDHEGWYAQREGIDIGSYTERAMRKAGHTWTDLGYMEAHIILRNVNTGKTAVLAVVHPGGGSAYALSYSIQKIVESYEGGEKPNVAFYGHYHKLWAGLIRNIWVAQTGTAQDQTPFMRKKRLEAHVGGIMAELEQDPETGAIVSMNSKMIRYFNKGFYAGGRWSHHGPIVQPERSTSAIR
jgi:hypothetical protein